MKTSKTQSTTKQINYNTLVAAIFPRQNGTSAGLSALQASLIRGKELAK